MPNVRPISQKKYNVSKNRFRELFYFCLQYPTWKAELKELTDSLGASFDGQPRAKGNISDSTGRLGERRATLSSKCDLIEQVAEEADTDLQTYIIKAVTTEGMTYNILRNRFKIPCGQTRYYAARRKFYYLLDKKLN